MCHRYIHLCHIIDSTLCVYYILHIKGNILFSVLCYSHRIYWPSFSLFSGKYIPRVGLWIIGEMRTALPIWANYCQYLEANSEKAMAPHSSTLAWKIPWMEEPGRLQSMRSLRIRHDWATSLSIFTFHFHALEKEMATHSSVLSWRIPGTGEPGGLPSMGSHRVGHEWSDLAAAAAAEAN